MRVKSGLDFEILLAPSELPDNLPFWAGFFGLGSSNTEGVSGTLK